MQDDNVVLHDYFDTITKFLNSEHFENQDSLRIFDKKKTHNIGIVVPKNSPLEPIFQKVINECRDEGLLDHLKSSNIGKRIKIKEQKKEKVKAVKIGHLAMIFIVLSIILTFTLFVLGIEILVSKFICVL